MCSCTWMLIIIAFPICGFHFMLCCTLRGLLLVLWQVVEACARSLKMIFHSRLAPKSDMFQSHRMELILQLLNHKNENVSEVAACVLARCCETAEHQLVFANAGGLRSLVVLLSGSVKTREAALDALAALTKNNKHLSETVINMNQGESLCLIIKLLKEKPPVTRLLACTCLINIEKACPEKFKSASSELLARDSMLGILLKLLDEPGQVGEDAPGDSSNTQLFCTWVS